MDCQAPDCECAAPSGRAIVSSELIAKLDAEREHAASQYGVMDLRIEDWDTLRAAVVAPSSSIEQRAVPVTADDVSVCSGMLIIHGPKARDALTELLALKGKQ